MAKQINENYLWLTRHGRALDRHSGKWVAIANAKLIAVSDSLKELLRKQEVKSTKHPLLHLVPRPEEAYSIL